MDNNVETAEIIEVTRQERIQTLIDKFSLI